MSEDQSHGLEGPITTDSSHGLQPVVVGPFSFVWNRKGPTMDNVVVTPEMVDRAVEASTAAAQARHEFEQRPKGSYADFELVNYIAAAWHARGVADALEWVTGKPSLHSFSGVLDDLTRERQPS